MTSLFARISLVFSCLALFLGQASHAELMPMSWKIGELERNALVYAPVGENAAKAPLVFVFHGHGGRSEHAAKQFRVHELWPNACVVYPQGVNTPGVLTDPKGRRTGWQPKPGELGDRDLRFFDRMLADVSKRYRVDPKRVYATGHSNGGAFSYLLWAERGDRLAAVGPSAAAGGGKYLGGARPMPVIHIAGENDRLVKYEWQKATIAVAKNLNRCVGEGRPWGDGATFYESKVDAPVVTVIHKKGHRFDTNASPAIVKFFKSQSKP